MDCVLISTYYASITRKTAFNRFWRRQNSGTKMRPWPARLFEIRKAWECQMDNILHHGILMNIKFSPNIFCVILAHKVLTRLIQLWVSNWQPFPHTPLGITHLHLSFSSFSWIIDTSSPSKHPPPNQLQKWYLQSAGIWHCPRKELEKGPSVFLSISFCRFQSYPSPTRLCCVVPCELYKIV